MSKDSAAALAQASETPRMALAPSRLLLGVPSRSIMIWSIWTCCSTAMSLSASKFDRLMRACGGARRHRRAAHRAVFQHHIDLDRGITAAIENFAADDVDDGGHGCLFENAGIEGCFYSKAWGGKRPRCP